MFVYLYVWLICMGLDIFFNYYICMVIDWYYNIYDCFVNINKRVEKNIRLKNKSYCIFCVGMFDYIFWLNV